MKKVTPILLAALLAPLTATLLKADTLAIYTFESSVPATAGPFSPEVGSGSALGFHSGATFPTTAYSSPAGNGSAHSFSANGWSVGDYYQFQVSALGYSGITLSWSQTSSGTGPQDFALQYSTDGSTFSPFATYAVLSNSNPPGFWNSTTPVSNYDYAYDLSSVSAINNAGTVYFRLVDLDTTSVSSATVGSGGTDRVDNFAIMAVPEPATLGLSVIGGLALLGLNMRRVRS